MTVKAKKPISQGAINAYPAKLLRRSKTDRVLALRPANAPGRGISSGLPVGSAMLLIKASLLHKIKGLLRTKSISPIL
jgi:hypothetical protein